MANKLNLSCIEINPLDRSCTKALNDNSIVLLSMTAMNSTHNLVLYFNPFAIDFIILPCHRFLAAFVIRDITFKTAKNRTFNKRLPW